MGYGYGFRPYVSVAKRRQRAAKKIAKLKKSGRAISPVEIEGRKIARTFWGESWCENLEAYSDYDNRLPRGRTYARNGSVIDLQIEAGRVRAMVSGSSFYDVDIKITPLAKKRWNTIKIQCAGKIDSMVELLQGSISKGVMEIVTRHGEGLFPSPKEISLSCSCPDWATMCKHVAAALYGVGARLDHEPEMLFTLRGVEPAEMIAAAVSDAPTTRKNGRGRILKTDDMSSVFGIDLDMGADDDGEQVSRQTRKKRKKATAKGSTKKASKVQATTAGQRKPAARTKATKKATSVSKKKASTKRARAAATKPPAKKTSAAKSAAKIATPRTSAAMKGKKTVTKKAPPKPNTPTAARKKAVSSRARKAPATSKKNVATRTRATGRRTGK